MPMVLDRSQRWRLAAAYTFLAVLCALVTFPFLVVLSVSLSAGNVATGRLIPPEWSLEHWRYALGLPYAAPDGQLVHPELPVLRWLWNSTQVALLAAGVTLLLSTTAAYALARLRFRGRAQVLSGLLLMQMFPAVLALVAIHALFERLGSAFPAIGIDTHWALLLAYSGGIATHVWMLKGYYDTIPRELEEAATVDGATPWQAFRLVLLPMALPALAVVFLLSFIGSVIEYPVASVLLLQEQNLTLAVGIQKLVDEHNFRWGDFAAVAILSGLPITAVFVIAQKWMVAGLTAGGTKG